MASGFNFSDKLLEWYKTNQRVLPWRSPSDEFIDPYKVWLSEIMLQQTTVVTVKPYFTNFIQRWPSFKELAKADLDEVLHAWQGLGYYSRARNLYKCAQIVTQDFNGKLPEDLKLLKKLPGIGDYTAAAILSIAFNKPATVIDGNVDRVISRFYAIKIPMPESKEEIKKYATQLTPEKYPGDYAQAMMDLGATVCTPKSPKCLLCAVREKCKAFESGEPETYPVKLPKNLKPQKYGYAFWIQREETQEILLRKRPLKGLLAGMMEIPSSEWIEEKLSLMQVQNQSPVKSEFKQTKHSIKHTFTHFSLELFICTATVPDSTKAPKDCIWCKETHLDNYALPTVMKKIIRNILI